MAKQSRLSSAVSQFYSLTAASHKYLEKLTVNLLRLLFQNANSRPFCSMASLRLAVGHPTASRKADSRKIIGNFDWEVKLAIGIYR